MSRNDMLRAALDAAECGWCVFPLVPGTKLPALHRADRCPRTGACTAGHAGWEQRATTDPHRIHECWSTAPYNIGIATGPSGLVVVDTDKPKPGKETPPAPWAAEGVRDGMDVFAVVCRTAGQPAPLDTYTVTTRRGGTHLYYRHPATGAQLRNTEGGTGNGLGWLVDTRAHGGYVVAAGSVVGGRPYTVTRDVDPVPLPGWLADRLRPRPLPPPKPVRVALATDRRGAYLDAVIRRQVAYVTDAVEPGRNRALYLSAARLGEFVAGGELPQTLVEAVLTEAAYAIGLHLDPPAGQIEKTIHSGLRAGARRPRSVAA